MGGRTDLA